MELPHNLLSKTSFLLSKCALLVTQSIENELEQFGIKAKHYAVMLLLTEASEMNQREIGKLLFIDRNTMVLVIDALETLKFVRREKSTVDRRAYNIILTDSGKSVLVKTTKVVDKIERSHLKSLNNEEIDQLNTTLIKFISSNTITNN